jgi:hypothetical protein
LGLSKLRTELENGFGRWGWRRERNWDPTFSEFVGAKSPQGQEPDSNCVAGVPRLATIT